MWTAGKREINFEGNNVFHDIQWASGMNLDLFTQLHSVRFITTAHILQKQSIYTIRFVSFSIRLTLAQRESVFKTSGTYWNISTFQDTFLPPINEVWGKVIFSQAYVIPSVHKGVCIQGVGSASRGVCILVGGGGLHPGGLHPGGRRTPPTPSHTMEYGQWTGSKHPTEKNSCVRTGFDYTGF